MNVRTYQKDAYVCACGPSLAKALLSKYALSCLDFLMDLCFAITSIDNEISFELVDQSIRILLLDLFAYIFFFWEDCLHISYEGVTKLMKGIEKPHPLGRKAYTVPKEI